MKIKDLIHITIVGFFHKGTQSPSVSSARCVNWLKPGPKKRVP